MTTPESLMRVALQALSLMFGGFGVFFLWLSFQAPRSAGHAILFIAVATWIVLALEKQAPPRAPTPAKAKSRLAQMKRWLGGSRRPPPE